MDEHLKLIKNKYPQVLTTKDYNDIIRDEEVEVVFIVTPPTTHFKIAKNAIKAGKHVFIEKPLTTDVKKAKILVNLAKKYRVKLAVGHVFLFNPVVKFIKSSLEKGTIGKLRHLHFQRRSLGPSIRGDVNVLWDLAPHDISMLLYFVNSKINSVIATGQSFLLKDIEDVVSASIKFKNGVIANMIFSWIDPVKIRDITIVGNKKMVLFDDVSEQKIKIFDKNANLIKNTTGGVSFLRYKIALHSGKIFSPKIKPVEPLKEEIECFINAVKNNSDTINNGENGLAVVRVVEAMQKSLSNNSKVIYF
jgi:predicted dehydrogenase